jgi:outer membrane lipoprotein-sorting protein
MRFKAIMAAVVLFVAASVSISAVPTVNGVDQILANMQAAASKIRTLQANISQVTKHKQIGGSSRFNGTATIQRGSAPGNEKAIVKYSTGQQISVVGDTITIAQPNIQQMIIASRSKLAAENNEYSFIATPFASTSSLKAKFDIAYSRDEGNMAVLELTPKVSNVQKSTIWVDKGSWLPTQFKAIEKNGDESFFTLSNVQQGVKVDANTFKVSCPNCKVIRK